MSEAPTNESNNRYGRRAHPFRFAVPIGIVVPFSTIGTPRNQNLSASCHTTATTANSVDTATCNTSCTPLVVNVPVSAGNDVDQVYPPNVGS